MIMITTIVNRTVTKVVLKHIRIMFPDGTDFHRTVTKVVLKPDNFPSLSLILSILVYTLFSRMFDLMQPPVVKHSIAVA